MGIVSYISMSVNKMRSTLCRELFKTGRFWQIFKYDYKLRIILDFVRYLEQNLLKHERAKPRNICSYEQVNIVIHYVFS